LKKKKSIQEIGKSIGRVWPHVPYSTLIKVQAYWMQKWSCRSLVFSSLSFCKYCELRKEMETYYCA